MFCETLTASTNGRRCIGLATFRRRDLRLNRKRHEMLCLALGQIAAQFQHLRGFPIFVRHQGLEPWTRRLRVCGSSQLS